MGRKVQKNTQLSFWWKAKSSSYEICLRGFHVGFLHGGELVLFWNNRVTKRFKGFTVKYMILSITVKEITFWNGNLIYVIENVSFTFDFQNYQKRGQICDKCSLEYFAMQPQNLCHNLKRVCVCLFVCLPSWWSLVRKRNIKVI